MNSLDTLVLGIFECGRKLTSWQNYRRLYDGYWIVRIAIPSVEMTIVLVLLRKRYFVVLLLGILT